jgi:outer membrane protein TolC
MSSTQHSNRVELPQSSDAFTVNQLIDFAESHNPETQIAWQRARRQADGLGIARSALFPTLEALAIVQTNRGRLLLGTEYYRQTISSAQPALSVAYTVFDFGAIRSQIDVAKANLLAADLAFNDTHRQLVFSVTDAYYRLLDAQGREGAATTNLATAQTIQQAAEERLRNGLATLPDVLEAKSVTARAQYELEATRGMGLIAQGELAKELDLSPESRIDVQPLAALNVPVDIPTNVKQVIDEALNKRPDLIAQIAHIWAADAAVRSAKTAYLPTLSFSGDGGTERIYGEQGQTPGAYTSGEVWQAELQLRWTLFNGGAREKELARAKADRRITEAELQRKQDDVEVEVWIAYSRLTTALRQRDAAEALLKASEESYTAAFESYKYGIRNFIDVASAQASLAQARTADVSAKVEVLTEFADLAFRMGSLTSTVPGQPAP